MSDPRTVRLVALLIGLTALAAVVGTIVLLTQGKSADAALAGLAGTALGYLAGVLTPSSGATPVTIRQPADNPVPVEEAGHIDFGTAAAAVAIIALGIVLAQLILRLIG